MKHIPFNKPFIVGKELYNISKAVIGGHLSGDGPYTEKCSQWLEDKLKAQRAFLTHSCTAALEMAAILCDIQPGDEIILPSYTFVSTANAFVLRGGVPVFVDIEPDTLNIDPHLIADALTAKTKAVVPVHYAGRPCAMDEIMDIADRRNLFVIEDAAQALLSEYKEKFLGTIGNLGTLSFHETKNIISGEGGALLVNDRSLIKRAEIIREKGTDRKRFIRGEVDKYTWVDIGSSYLLGELSAAFLWAQLEEAEKIIKKRRSLCNRYRAHLKSICTTYGISINAPLGNNRDNGHLVYIMTSSLEERNQLIEHLKENEILAVFHYVPLHSSPAGGKYGRISGRMTHTDCLSQRILRLPLYYGMEESDVDRVCGAVEEYYYGRSLKKGS